MIKTILLADDSITMQKVIRLTFASGGYELVTADNGAEAIKKAEDLRPHIIMVDAALPGKNGYEVCEAIKNNYQLKNIPVLLLAGTFNPLDENEARRVKADDSIVKPFESKHLIEKVEHLFRKFPPVEREEGAGDSPAAASKENIWEDDDIIEAPEPSSAVSMAPTPDRVTPEDNAPLSTNEIPGFETFDGRGYLNGGNDENTAGQGAEGAGQMPEMKTAEGDSEGVGGFDIEGFEINPFKSEPLREEPIFEEPEDSSDTWGVDETDVSGFDDLEPESEIEAEEATGEAKEDADKNQAAEVDIKEQSSGSDESVYEDEPVAGRDELEEDVIVAEEKPSEEETEEIESEEDIHEEKSGTDEHDGAGEDREKDIIIAEEGPEEEETATAGAEEESAVEETEEATCEKPLPSEESPDRDDEDTIRDLVRKASMDVIEEVVRDVVPELIKKALEEEIERIKESLKTI
jgi:CheY-like chemotaxis protein